MKKSLSVKQLYKKYSKNNLQKNSSFFDEMWYSRYFGRKISIYFTWFFLKINRGPNTATFASLIIGFIGTIFIALPGLVNLLLGSFLFQLYIILDSSDGELARIMKIKNNFGPYMDRLLHVFMYVFLHISIGINIYLRTMNTYYLILGLIVVILMLVAIIINYIDPLANKNSYEEYRSGESGLMAYLRNIYNFITGDVEIVLILTVLAPLQYLGLIDIDFYSLILMTNLFLIFFGGILYSLYSKYNDPRYQ